MEPDHYLSDLNVNSMRCLVHVKILSIWKEPLVHGRVETRMVLADEKVKHYMTMDCVLSLLYR
ncbi:predicted protein [Arabidopsis lyrata subsp. lyrata]|uniref:Predicted protein n=1 Tax=Arabidopsis lyrata subsp. lyrata TaxID=81972 RepID=D7MUW0_ARALL|nr:predicted protein [Arabidopsis lyrata subsp. lyrata]